MPSCFPSMTSTADVAEDDTRSFENSSLVDLVGLVENFAQYLADLLILVDVDFDEFANFLCAVHLPEECLLSAVGKMGKRRQKNKNY